jgi:3-hydroxybutyrate dehydrogenase
MFLKGRTALVTGATSGIGLAYARALAAEGAALMINGFGEEAVIAALCEELAASSGAPVVYNGADLAQRAGIKTMMAQAEEAFGGVDILVSNAGIQHVAPVEAFPVEKWDAILALNLTAAFDAARLAVPAMKSKGWGRIISTASAHATTASPFKAAYVAAKHGLLGLTRTLALELAESGVTANCISPGYVWTPLVESQIPETMAARNMSRKQVVNDVMLVRQPTRKFVRAEEVAAMAVFLCRDEAANITGANLTIDGGWTAQ